MVARDRRRRGSDGHENEERWLLTYADMITLLLALFMVLFSISSVNISKFESVKTSLTEAFSGTVMPGGKSFQEAGGADQMENPKPEPPFPSVVTKLAADGPSDRRRRKQAEQEDFEKLKREVDQLARERGLEGKLQTTVTRRGLVIRLLTDGILFESGQALIKPQGARLVGQIGRLLKFEVRHPIYVEGHTDSVPISSAVYPTNWELSTGRAASVVRALIQEGVGRSRLAAAGYADLHPVGTNASEGGRSRNRRVEIVLTRLDPDQDQDSESK